MDNSKFDNLTRRIGRKTFIKGGIGAMLAAVGLAAVRKDIDAQYSCYCVPKQLITGRWVNQKCTNWYKCDGPDADTYHDDWCGQTFWYWTSACPK
jgi:hypothetical protein